MIAEKVSKTPRLKQVIDPGLASGGGQVWLDPVLQTHLHKLAAYTFNTKQTFNCFSGKSVAL
ncbi:hypothetical protein ABID22_003661 [Pontibacter aydingkolensis]